MSLFSQEFSEIGYKPGLNGLGVVNDDDLLKYVGIPRNMLTDEELSVWTPIIEAAKQRDAAQAKADAAYDSYIAARQAAYPQAAAALVFDSTGRATDSSVAQANAIQAQAASNEYAALQAAEIAAQTAAAREIAVVNQTSAPVVTQIQIPTYSDAQIATAAHDMYISGMQPSEVIVNLKNKFLISNERATTIANAEYYKVYPGTGAQTAIQPGSSVTTTVTQKMLSPTEVVALYKKYVISGTITRSAFIEQMHSQGVSDTVLTQAQALLDSEKKTIIEPPYIQTTPPPVKTSGAGTLILAALAAYLIGS